MNNEIKTYPWNGLIAILMFPILLLALCFAIFILVSLFLVYVISDFIRAYRRNIKTEPFKHWEMFGKFVDDFMALTSKND